MGCSPSTLPNSSSTAAPGGVGADANAPLPLDANEKDGSLLFCIKLRRSRMRRCSCGAVTLQNQNGDGSTGSATCGDNMMCNQVLLNPQQTKNESDYEKLSTGKKDSIVTVAALGNFTHTVVRRATGTGSTGTSGTSSSGGGRPGHRKSSLALALTPEDEPMDVSTGVII
ncbi:hypothetical protein ACLKA6_015191 [Drosophila palustris]